MKQADRRNILVHQDRPGPQSFSSQPQWLSNELFLSAQPIAGPAGPQPIHAQLLRETGVPTPILQKRK